MKQATTELIARLEAAAEGSRELDAAIYSILQGRQIPVRQIEAADGFGVELAPHYTTSLDAALVRLVPPGMWWTVAAGKIAPNEPLFGAAIYRPDYLAITSPIAVGEHPTSVAIALCIAALRSQK